LWKHHLVQVLRWKYLLNSGSGKSRDSAVSIVTRYGLDSWGVGVQVPVGARFFSSPHPPDRFWSPSSFLSNGSLGTGVLSPGREADHSPPNSAEVKNTWIYTSTAP
jgi:hypothetical protein